MTHPRNAPPDRNNSAGADAQTAAFLRDLRALRDQAGLGTRDLAARAHFPEETLTTAEAGPSLPTLPVLQAYVRGCGAPELDWEDRWRRINTGGDAEALVLPTRAPADARPPARVMPFPETGPAEQDAIGFGLARVARGLAPLSPDPATPQPDIGGYPPFGGVSDPAPSAGGWFDPAHGTTAPPAASYSPPPAPPAPPVNPGAPTLQYPASNGYQAPEPSYQPPAPQPPTSYTTPSYRLPEEFRTPVSPPPDLSGPGGGPGSSPAAPATPGGTRQLGGGGPGPSAGPAGAGRPLAGRSAPSGPASAGPAPGTASAPKPHAAPSAPHRRTSGWVVATVIVVLLIIAAILWLVLGH